MRHANSSGSTPPRFVSRHRPRSRSLGRADHIQARASDIVLALTGFALLGAFALFAAVSLIGRGGAF